MDRDWKFCICDFETTGIDYDKSLPIEVGCVFTNAQFDVVASYESLIMWPELQDLDGWPDWAAKAYEFHKIYFQVYKDYAKSFGEVCADIVDFNHQVNNIKENRKTILLSDNAHFEFNFMRKMFQRASIEFPFHYCAWDSSLLLETTGIGDPPSEIVDHRALADAGQLHKYIIRSLEKVKYFG